MFFLRRPALEDTRRFLSSLPSAAISYDRMGIAEEGAEGFTVDETTMVIGRGERDYERACKALASWTHFKLGWLDVFPADAPIAPGTNVAVRIRHLGFWSLNGSRVVYSLGDEPRRRRFGFAYGTLARHAERGEELFEVSLDSASSDVTYRIRAASRPGALLAWLGYPIGRSLQARCRRESAEAMRRAVVGD